jgi:hypothetical protein
MGQSRLPCSESKVIIRSFSSSSMVCCAHASYATIRSTSPRFLASLLAAVCCGCTHSRTPLCFTTQMTSPRMLTATACGKTVRCESTPEHDHSNVHAGAHPITCCHTRAPQVNRIVDDAHVTALRLKVGSPDTAMFASVCMRNYVFDSTVQTGDSPNGNAFLSRRPGARHPHHVLDIAGREPARRHQRPPLRPQRRGQDSGGSGEDPPQGTLCSCGQLADRDCVGQARPGHDRPAFVFQPQPAAPVAASPGPVAQQPTDSSAPATPEAGDNSSGAANQRSPSSLEKKAEEYGWHVHSVANH